MPVSVKSPFTGLRSTVYKDSPLGGSKGAGNSEIILLSINPTGSRLVNARTDKAIRVWKCSSDKLHDPITVEQPHVKAVESVSWHPKHEYTFATVGRDHLVKIWKTSSSGCTVEREVRVNRNDNSRHGMSVCQIVKYSADGEVMAVVDRDSTISLFNTSNYTMFKQFKMGEHVFDFTWFNSGHSHFMIGLHNGTVEVYKVKENDDEPVEKVHTLKGHRSSVTTVALDPRGQYIAIGSNEGVVSLWNTENLLNEGTISSIDESIAQVDVSRDGAYLALTFDRNINIRIFDSETLKEIYEVENSSSGNLVLSTFRWFPNRQNFVCTSDGGKSMTYVRK
ncbi:hypothetical protein CAAN1_03S05644 [[Candida] anglica]|uniref:Anaphase-promoting complex subunit 4 WD40 domain-containing protein n=1 Tax=[Candida] anglica TaxID=148631 RepID=A0ABP0EH56_9ASCO